MPFRVKFGPDVQNVRRTAILKYGVESPLDCPAHDASPRPKVARERAAFTDFCGGFFVAYLREIQF